MSDETTESTDAFDLKADLDTVFEVRIFYRFNNLFEVVSKVHGSGNDGVTLERAINLLHTLYERKDTTAFFGQVWEVNPNNRLHYEINGDKVNG